MQRHNTISVEICVALFMYTFRSYSFKVIKTATGLVIDRVNQSCAGYKSPTLYRALSVMAGCCLDDRSILVCNSARCTTKTLLERTKRTAWLVQSVLSGLVISSLLQIHSSGPHIEFGVEAQRFWNECKNEVPKKRVKIHRRKQGEQSVTEIIFSSFRSLRYFCCFCRPPPGPPYQLRHGRPVSRTQFCRRGNEVVEGKIGKQRNFSRCTITTCHWEDGHMNNYYRCLENRRGVFD